MCLLVAVVVVDIVRVVVVHSGDHPSKQMSPSLATKHSIDPIAQGAGPCDRLSGRQYIEESNTRHGTTREGDGPNRGPRVYKSVSPHTP